MSVRAWWRRVMNLDGPWVCTQCACWTMQNTPEGRLRCTNCGHFSSPMDFHDR